MISAGRQRSLHSDGLHINSSSSECDALPRLWRCSHSALSSDVEEFREREVEDEDEDGDDGDGDDDDDDEDEDRNRQFSNMKGPRRLRSVGPTARLALLFLILLVILGFGSLPCNAKISDKRLCYDKDCSVVVSHGKTIISYNSKDRDVLSFPVNADVKIFSKQAGKRQDLWGVEIRGKRGYAPLKFIREYKIIQSKLENVVPTEQFGSEPVQNVQNAEISTENSSDSYSDSVQEGSTKTNVPADEVNINFQADTIIPHQVSPSYDSMYDGTIIPEENEDVEAPPASYSTKTLQDNVKVDDQVQLNMYPNILSSTFSALSGILGSRGKTSEEESIEVASSEQTESEETTEKTPEIDKADESSLNFQKKEDVIPQNVVPENIATDVIPENNISANLAPKDNIAADVIPEENTTTDIISEDNISTKVVSESNIVEHAIQENNSVTDVQENIAAGVQENIATYVQENIAAGVQENIAGDLQENVAENLIPEGSIEAVSNETILQPEKSKIISESETPSLIQPEVNETISESETIEQDNVKEKTELNISEENIENHSIESTKSESNIKDFLTPVGVNIDKSSKNDIEQPVTEYLLNDTVPKQEETVIVTNNSASVENITDEITVTNETILDKQEVNVNDAFVNSANVENSITPEVPLKQEFEEESVTPSNNSLLSYEESFPQNLSENQSMPIENNIEIGDNLTASNVFVEESKLIDTSFESQLEVNDNIVDSNNNVIDDSSYTTSIPTYLHIDSAVENADSGFRSADSSHDHIVDIPSTSSFGEFLGNRNLLNAGKGFQLDDYSEGIGVEKVLIDEIVQTATSFVSDENLSSEVKQEEDNVSSEEVPPTRNAEKIVIPPESCDKNYDCSGEHTRHQHFADENEVTNARKMADSSETLLYVCITAVTTLLFSLGYYFIENRRRDAYLIAKINNLEKDLMVTRKECIMLDENFKSTKTKLDSIEDESFGSNEMVLSLKAEIVASENARVELEDQIASLEKELESTSEAGLELERMLREILSSHSEENNPLAQSIEDLQVRLNDQQVANESLTNALALKTHENETLTGDLTVSLKKVEQLQTEVTKLVEELQKETSTKIHLEQTLVNQVQKLELEIKNVTEDKTHLRKQLRTKELEVKELLEVVEQMNANSLDFEKLYEVSQIKAEAAHLLEERDELRIKLSEEEGAHHLLEEHVKLVREEVAFLGEQCKAAEKEKKDAETRLEVLTKFFEEKEAQRQKEETLWLEKQGEVSSTVERLHTMQNEILNYKQQIEMLKREIMDQEREYKNQISSLETKAHEHWVTARQNERRLEEVKAESSQLRNRLTLVEKNITDGDPEVKLHHLQGSNGETSALGVRHPLFAGETSSSPLLFVGSGPGGGVVPAPPSSHSYLYGAPLPPPGAFPLPSPHFLPPPLASGSGGGGANVGDLVGSRPPPLGGGRRSSPPPPQLTSSSGGRHGDGRGGSSNGANPVGSPPLSPPPLPSLHGFLPPPHHHHQHHQHHLQHHPLDRHRSPPPLPPFAASDVPPPPHLQHHVVPPPLMPPLHHPQRDQQHSSGNPHNSTSQWGAEALLPPNLRNPTSALSSFYAHQQRDQQRQSRNHKGSLHSSGESLEKSHHGGKA